MMFLPSTIKSIRLLFRFLIVKCIQVIKVSPAPPPQHRRLQKVSLHSLTQLTSTNHGSPMRLPFVKSEASDLTNGNRIGDPWLVEVSCVRLCRLTFCSLLCWGGGAGDTFITCIHLTIKKRKSKRMLLIVEGKNITLEGSTLISPLSPRP